MRDGETRSLGRRAARFCRRRERPSGQRTPIRPVATPGPLGGTSVELGRVLPIRLRRAATRNGPRAQDELPPTGSSPSLALGRPIGATISRPPTREARAPATGSSSSPSERCPGLELRGHKQGGAVKAVRGAFTAPQSLPRQSSRSSGMVRVGSGRSGGGAGTDHRHGSERRLLHGARHHTPVETGMDEGTIAGPDARLKRAAAGRGFPGVFPEPRQQPGCSTVV